MKRMMIAILLVAGVALAAEEKEEPPLKLGPDVKIDSYEQGKITIGGKLIRTDIIILPDGTVQHPWATEKRHVLTQEDIPDLLALKLDVLIIGTGRQGNMKPTATLKKDLKEKGFEVLILKTTQAIEKLNALRKEGKQVAACFHIGC